MAEAAAGTVALDDLFATLTRADPYAGLTRARFDAVVEMLAQGFPTEHGRRGILIGLDHAQGRAIARKGAKLLAIASGGTIPDSGDYKVRLDPDGMVVGAIAEDFAIHQMPGHVLQLGSNTWRVRQVGNGEVRVEGAPGEAPYMPVWFGESPARSDELSAEVRRLRAEVAAAPDTETAAAHLACDWFDPSAATQLATYLRAGAEALGTMPDGRTIVTERFTDLAGTEQVVVHAPLGQRIIRAWALALRHVLGVRHGVEIQAAATDDGFLLSLPGTVRFAPGDTLGPLTAATAADLVAQAVLDVPMFAIRWRWATARALMVPRMRGGKRVPPYIQRSDADELLLSTFPSLRVGQSLRIEAKMGGATAARATLAAQSIPDHPLIAQTLADCLFEAMDLPGFIDLLARIEARQVALRHVDRLTPSPLAFAVITAKPPAFLDNGALMDRRARNVAPGPRHLEVQAEAALHPDAIAKISAEVAPDLTTEDDLAQHLTLAGVLSAQDAPDLAPRLSALAEAGRALPFHAPNGQPLWAAPERMARLAAAFPMLGTVQGDPVAALASALRGRMEVAGPLTLEQVAEPLGLPPDTVTPALTRLQDDGHILSGHFDPDRPDQILWCDRRVLSRIDRLTRNRLRAEVEPVSLRDYYRFLLRWHGLTDATRRRGRAGPAQDRPKLTRATPISLFATDNADLWRSIAPPATPAVSPRAEPVLAAFTIRGASFAAQVERDARMLRADFEEGLAELVAAGRITADSFAGLRALLANPTKLRISRLYLIANTNAGRWSLLPTSDTLTDPIAHEAAVVATSDPLNLTGTLGGQARVPASPDSQILIRDGVPVALRKGAVVKPLTGLPKDDAAPPIWPERVLPRALSVWK